MSHPNIDNSERNVLGDVGLWLTATSWILVFVFSLPPLNFLLPIPAALCPLGLVLGIVGLWSEPHRTAGWAVGLGVLGMHFFVGTIWSRVLIFMQ